MGNLLTWRQAVHHAASTLTLAGIEDALLEAEVLLSHVLGVSRTQLYINWEQELTPEQMEKFCYLIKRRLRREPTAYIVGYREFYGLEFHVDCRVFIPRPESELLVEKALEQATSFSSCQRLVNMDKPILIADIGTGSGALAICLAVHLPRVKVYAIDISSAALEVAVVNCQKHGVADKVVLLNGHLLEPLAEPVNLIIANLPYIEDSELSKLSPEVVGFEPLLAISGGKNGLGEIRSLISQIKEKLSPRGCLLLEIGVGQEEEVISLVNCYLPQAEVELVPDLNGINRVIKISRNQ